MLSLSLHECAMKGALRIVWAPNLRLAGCEVELNAILLRVL